MGKGTEIGWTHNTHNHWWGCTKVGPGCDHCYAASFDHRLGGNHWGPGVPRRLTSEANRNRPLIWNVHAEMAGKPTMVFCQSMSDWLDNEVPPEWRAHLCDIIERTPHLRWQMLTKRIGNLKGMVPSHWLERWPQHVGVMATVCNQDEAVRDISKLCRLKSELDFPWIGLSCEPLLGAIDLHSPDLDQRYIHTLDWVIVGGESGHGARPMHPNWARLLQRQCVEACVPFFFKQWGDWCPPDQAQVVRLSKVGAAEHVFADDAWSLRVGKVDAGRALDGTTWSEFPEALLS